MIRAVESSMSDPPSDDIAGGQDGEDPAELEEAVDEVKRLREETELKASELDQALARLRTLIAQRSEPAEPPPPRRSPHPDAGDDGVTEEAMLVATEMAVSGSDRDEIEAALRERFGTTDPGPIVDHILGAGRSGS
jgi:hypothetical protein